MNFDLDSALDGNVDKFESKFGSQAQSKDTKSPSDGSPPPGSA